MVPAAAVLEPDEAGLDFDGFFPLEAIVAIVTFGEDAESLESFC